MKGILGCLLMAAALSAETPQELFQKALVKERSEGDLKEAIRLYERTAEAAGKDRALAAKALLEAGECHRKLGDAQARKLFERVVRDYADQNEAATLARARLGTESRASHSLTFRQVWKLPNRASIEGTASRDGRYFPYVAWAEKGDLFLHDFVTGQERRLTNTATDSMPRPKVEQSADEYSFSQDGKHLAYSWFSEDQHKRYDLRIIDLKGDAIPQPRLLFENPDVEWIAPSDWSPDGKWIAVRIQRTDKTAQIGLVSVADGSLRVLKSVDWRGAERLFISPDGKYLGFDLPQAETSQQRDVFVMALDGSREIPAVVHRAHDKMMGWSPDGRRLLFASDRSGSTDLWSLPFVDGRVQGEPELIKTDIGQAETVAVTRSGALYLGISTGISKQVHIQVAAFDVNAGKLLSAPIDVPQDYRESSERPNWSADGHYFAYFSVRGRPGSATRTLVIRSAETRQLIRELPVKMNQVRGNRWAPDGRSLLHWGVDLKGRSGFFQTDVQTGEISPILFGSWNEISYPLWSNDGKSIYFTRHFPGDEQALVQRDLASGNEKELLRRTGIVAEPISPDGRYMAAAARDGSSGAWLKLLIPTAGGAPREMMRVPSGRRDDIRLVGASWTPDSRSFFTWKVLNDEKQTVEVWRVPVDGGVPVKVDLGGVGMFQLHPDGRQIVFPVPEKGPPRRQEVWALENFLPPSSTAKR